MHVPNRKGILVTGGSGFLGSHLCERLLEDGCDVLCLEYFYSGIKENVAHLIVNSNFELMRHDVTFPRSVDLDEIYNLAYRASPIHYLWDPVHTTKSRVYGEIKMLELATRTKRKISQASTSVVYDDSEIQSQQESYGGRVNPIGIRSCYDEGKRCSETQFLEYHRQHWLEINVVRIFSTWSSHAY